MADKKPSKYQVRQKMQQEARSARPIWMRRKEQENDPELAGIDEVGPVERQKGWLPFDEAVDKLGENPRVSNPQALATWIGQQTWGREEFNSAAANGHPLPIQETSVQTSRKQQGESRRDKRREPARREDDKVIKRVTASEALGNLLKGRRGKGTDD